MSSLVFNPEIVDDQQGYELGTVGWQQGNAYRYVRPSAAVDYNSTTGGDVVYINGANRCAKLTTTLATGTAYAVGVVVVDIPSGDYGWVQVYGRAHAKAAAGVAVNKQMYSHATAGDVDDATGSSAVKLLGMTAAVAGTAAAGVQVSMSFPVPA